MLWNQRGVVIERRTFASFPPRITCDPHQQEYIYLVRSCLNNLSPSPHFKPALNPKTRPT